MPRLQLVELEDLPWFPSPVRDAATGYLQLVIDVSDPYAPAAPELVAAIRRSGATRLVDLCSGGGGPWRRLKGELEAAGLDLPVVLTDKFPNPGAAEAVRANGAAGAITLHAQPVDATQVPPALGDFRTMFSAFHHFPPHSARAVLDDVVRNGVPIAIFEATKRNPTCFLFMFLAPVMTLLLMPRVRPFRWTNLLFTYVIPLVPLMVLWDGLVSCLRTYDVGELRALADSVPGSERFEWDIGELAGKNPIPVTYLLGIPRS